MWALYRFISRRDRLQVLLWYIGLIGLTLAVALAFAELYQTEAERLSMVMTMSNPAMIAMVGPIYGESLGAIMANNMLLFTALGVAVMNIFLVTRHTRADEELGRLEVIRSLPVSRLSNLGSVFIHAGVVNALFAILTGIGLWVLGIESMGFSGSMLYGAALGMTGLLFAAATALFVQLSANNRAVLSYAFTFLGAAYILRAVGDVGNETLSAVALLGLSTRTEVFVNDYWWPVGVGILVSAALGGAALYLNARRDLGSGFFAARPGKSEASRWLSTPFGLTWRLTKGTILGWSIAIFILAASYGSIFGDLEEFLYSLEFLREMLSNNGNESSLVQQFMGFIMVMLAILSAVPGILVVFKLRGEERQNRVEHLLGRQVCRARLIAGYGILAFAASALMLFLAGLGLFSAANAVVDEPLELWVVIQAAMAFLPALWVMDGLALLLVGFKPGLSVIAWAYLVYSFTVVYLGELLQFPGWLINLSPFGHIPRIPAEAFSWSPVMLLSVIGLGLAAGGIFGFRQRDVEG